MNRFINLVLLVVFGVVIYSLFASPTGDYKVIGVSDGDTITVLDGTTQIKVRLAEIDAPESKQPFGSKAKEVLSDKVFGKYVKLDVIEKDRWGRSVAKVYLGNRHINLEMVQEGFAWNYTQYSKSAAMAEAQEYAKGKKLGLWADRSQTPPWEFRSRR